MILLDTNVLSALMFHTPVQRVVEWLDAQPDNSVWTTSVTIFEVRFGLQTMPTGKKQTALLGLFDIVLAEVIEGRIAPFDTAAAERTAELLAARKQRGRMGELRDAMIAGIALSSRAQLATRNTKHFDDLPISLINPWNH